MPDDNEAIKHKRSARDSSSEQLGGDSDQLREAQNRRIASEQILRMTETSTWENTEYRFVIKFNNSSTNRQQETKTELGTTKSYTRANEKDRGQSREHARAEGTEVNVLAEKRQKTKPGRSLHIKNENSIWIPLVWRSLLTSDASGQQLSPPHTSNNFIFLVVIFNKVKI